MDRVLKLHEDLVSLRYLHGAYHAFKINDPKPRDIHKATVRDRLVHHAVYRKLYPHFDRTFIADSYSCRVGGGTHRARERFVSFSRKVSCNNTRTCWVLKCDIRKFFASIDHATLFSILRRGILDKKLIWLVYSIIKSFNSGREYVGLPLGNLTSQLLVNVYMNEFDQFVKHRLKIKYYIRYADDFVFLSDSKLELESLLPRIQEFLLKKLKLSLHPQKVSISTLASGIDFLGWVHFPDHAVLRTTTKRRMLNRIRSNPTDSVKGSYRGMLSHGNARKLEKVLIRE